MDKERKRLDFQLRARLIYEAIAEAPEPVDIKQICEATGLKRTPYLAHILDWLWSRQFIARTFDVRANGYAATVHWVINEWVDK